jgi:hypothetical protein
MSGRRSVSSALRQVLGRSVPTRGMRTPAIALSRPPRPGASAGEVQSQKSQVPAANPNTCVHLFERGRCRWCGMSSLGRAGRRLEKTEQSQIVHLLRSIGGYAYEIGTRRPRGDYQGTCQTPGLGDVFAFLPIKLNKPNELWCECKSATGRLRPEQRLFRERCIERGIPHVVGTLEAVSAWLLAHEFLLSGQVAHYRTTDPRVDDVHRTCTCNWHIALRGAMPPIE